MQNNKIDVISFDPKKEEMALILVLEKDWGEEPDRLLRLQDRLNQYLAFALDGGLAKKYSNQKYKSVRIQIDCYAHVDNDLKDFLFQAEKLIEKNGVRFVFRKVPGTKGTRNKLS